jgi:high-affinity iron transporter
MFTIALVSFRETFEMVLIIVPLLAYVTRLGRKDLVKYIYLGTFIGLLASILCGGFLLISANNLEGFSANIFRGSMSLFVCALIVYSIVWLNKRNSSSNTGIESKYNFQTTGISLFLLSLLTIFRDCLELVLFSLPLHELGFFKIIMAILLGLFVTIVLSIIIYKTSVKLNLNLVFSLITLVLIYIGSKMFGEGLATLLPQYGNSLITAGQMIFGIPILYLFLKKEIKKYTKKI